MVAGALKAMIEPKSCGKAEPCRYTVAMRAVRRPKLLPQNQGQAILAVPDHDNLRVRALG
jgi:hypothetical protein